MKSILWLLLFLSFNAFSSGVRGGGVTVDVNSVPRLRDLEDKTVCNWTRFDMLLTNSERRELDKVLTSLRKVHWYLADTYMRERKRLRVCQTAKLVELDVDSENYVYVAENSNQRQVAIRLNDKVYLDVGLFKKMPLKDRVFLVLHEITHSFIPLNIEFRNEYVRSMVDGIYKNSQYLMSPDIFALYIEENHLFHQSTVERIDEIYDAVNVLLSSQERMSDKLNAYYKVGFNKLEENLIYLDLDSVAGVIEGYFAPLKEAVIGNDYRRVSQEVGSHLKTDVVLPSGKSLIDLANDKSSNRVIKLLMKYTSNEGQVPSKVSDEMVYKYLQGQMRRHSNYYQIVKNSNPNTIFKNHNGSMSLLAMAFNKKDFDIVKIYLNEHFELQKNTIAQVITPLVANGYNDFVKSLYTDERILIDENFSRQGSVVNIALKETNYELFSWLFARVKNPNKLELTGQTYLHTAIGLSKVHYKKFTNEILKRVDLDVMTKNDSGENVFDMAYKIGRRDLLSLIVKHPSFRVNVTGAPAQRYRKHLSILEIFVELNDVKSSKLILSKENFKYFDLIKLRDLCEFKGRLQLARVLTAAMQR